ncbi:unnamed protein product [Triticum turgidum subsp. durum]|uniref:NAD-dependent epimerase/dehydratase domain-containing protein n=1 Tax=Triticum turgidum subsp. durum TaxID=4567 RepID=A0A9R1QRJ5_TRITD|nr:unnamed protein product [Triticum turgidum subsp. durum]
MALAGGDGRGELVCVTGGSGFIGSWLVRLLLDRGYTVHATVQNLQDEGETKHLQALDGADTRLRLFQMDLLDPASVRPAIQGVHGVFHLASPVILQPAQDPENELLLPAVNGALNVLRAAKDSGVKRVVMVSSQTAMCPTADWPADKVIDDDCWADVEILKKLELWYNVSKTLAEKAAWDFAGEEGLKLVVLNPGLVLGPTLTPAPTGSLRLLMLLLGGQSVATYRVFCSSIARSLTWNPSSLAALTSEMWHNLWWCSMRTRRRRDATCAWSPPYASSISTMNLLIFTLNSRFTGSRRTNRAGW